MADDEWQKKHNERLAEERRQTNRRLELEREEKQRKVAKEKSDKDYADALERANKAGEKLNRESWERMRAGGGGSSCLFSLLIIFSIGLVGAYGFYQFLP